MTDAQPGRSAQAENDKRAARHAKDLRQRRGRILATGLAVAIVAVVVLIVVGPWYGVIVLLLDLVLMMSALLTKPNSITAWQTWAAGEVMTGGLLEPLEA
jgi:hypothetical protein